MVPPPEKSYKQGGGVPPRQIDGRGGKLHSPASFYFDSKRYKEKIMKNIRPAYVKALMAAIVIYLIGMTIIVSDLYRKAGGLEHRLVHMSAEHKPHK